MDLTQPLKRPTLSRPGPGPTVSAPGADPLFPGSNPEAFTGAEQRGKVPSIWAFIDQHRTGWNQSNPDTEVFDPMLTYPIDST
jgi:hypothetical protein